MSQKGRLGGETGKFLQTVTIETTAYLSTNVVIPIDNTIPQITEGAALLNRSITARSATNYFVFTFSCFRAVVSNNFCSFAIFEDATANAIYAHTSSTSAAFTDAPAFQFLRIAGDTNAHTYSLRFGVGTAIDTVFLNGFGANALFGGVAKTVFTISEIEL